MKWALEMAMGEWHRCWFPVLRLRTWSRIRSIWSIGIGRLSCWVGCDDFSSSGKQAWIHGFPYGLFLPQITQRLLYLVWKRCSLHFSLLLIYPNFPISLSIFLFYSFPPYHVSNSSFFSITFTYLLPQHLYSLVYNHLFTIGPAYILPPYFHPVCF